MFQLHNLFDVSRELTGSFEEEAIQSRITTTVMGHFLVSRCALYLLGPQGLALAHERGLRRQAREPAHPARSGAGRAPGAPEAEIGGRAAATDRSAGGSSRAGSPSRCR